MMRRVLVCRFFCNFALHYLTPPHVKASMTSQELLRIVFSFLPFVVCLFWAICYAVQVRRCSAPKRYMTAYFVTCSLLYLCHALFFTLGLPYEMECLWTLCSLSVYPLFFGYLCRLTDHTYSFRHLWPWLIPGLFVAVAKYTFPNAGLDKLRLLLFACQIVSVCYLGIRKLKVFDKKLQTVYADTEGRDTTAVHHLLVAIITVSILCGVANSVGKQFFGESLWLLIPISLAFTIMQFSLGYITFYRDFTIDQLVVDEKEAEPVKESADQEDGEFIGRKIEQLMIEQHYFLKNDLKIGDVVKEIGSNRTYVSNYINRTYQCSFSDYMNNLRIEYAKKLLATAGGSMKLTQIAEESGFTNEQSFYRNFKKFTGMTPADWQRREKMGEKAGQTTSD